MHGRPILIEKTYAIATGRLVRAPKVKDAMPAITAVAVIRSRRTAVNVSRSQAKK